MGINLASQSIFFPINNESIIILIGGIVTFIVVAIIYFSYKIKTRHILDHQESYRQYKLELGHLDRAEQLNQQLERKLLSIVINGNADNVDAMLQQLAISEVDLEFLVQSLVSKGYLRIVAYGEAEITPIGYQYLDASTNE